MFRTRDFVLIFTTVVFLFGAIGATLASRFLNTPSSEFILQPIVESLPTEYSHSAHNDVDSIEVERQQRLRFLKEKIASDASLVVIAESIPEYGEVEMREPDMSSEQRCEDYAVSSQVSLYTGVQFSVVEGSRVVTFTHTSSSTTTRQTLLQLPILHVPNFTPSCIASDVIGIAQDGSLIRNNEATLYSVFSTEVLIGYALDGFPIYGANDVETDTCGGRMVAGKYRYELSHERDTIIRCFSGSPIDL